jgi:hypothetical protein
MKSSITSLAGALALLSVPGTTLAQSSEENYINSVCSPNITSPNSGPLPPCIGVTNIEYACAPNGTSPLALDAHAQCLCKGSYFRDWQGCQRCLLVHGARSDRDAVYYSSVLTVASQQLCTGTPTAVFASLFSSAQGSVQYPTAGNTAKSDVKSGDTAISLYFTPSGTGASGPGQITGSALAATATGPTRITNAGTSSTTRAPGGTTPGQATITNASSTSRSSNPAAAAPTGGNGWWLAAAGGALVAAL